MCLPHSHHCLVKPNGSATVLTVKWIQGALQPHHSSLFTQNHSRSYSWWRLVMHLHFSHGGQWKIEFQLLFGRNSK